MWRSVRYRWQFEEIFRRLLRIVDTLHFFLRRYITSDTLHQVDLSFEPSVRANRETSCVRSWQKETDATSGSHRDSFHAVHAFTIERSRKRSESSISQSRKHEVSSIVGEGRGRGREGARNETQRWKKGSVSRFYDRTSSTPENPPGRCKSSKSMKPQPPVPTRRNRCY